MLRKPSDRFFLLVGGPIATVWIIVALTAGYGVAYWSLCAAFVLSAIISLGLATREFFS